jgi:hypothetical protein
LVRFGSRDYDPNVGRWTSKDPLKFQGGQINVYIYANNDPVNMIDLDGRSCFCGEALNDLVRTGPAAWCVPFVVARAEEAADATQLPGALGGLQDAFRHCELSCLLTQCGGDNFAEQVTDIHEECNPNPPEDTCMDQHNNGVGRGLASSNGGADCEASCSQALMGGWLQTSAGCL